MGLTTNREGAEIAESNPTSKRETKEKVCLDRGLVPQHTGGQVRFLNGRLRLLACRFRGHRPLQCADDRRGVKCRDDRHEQEETSDILEDAGWIEAAVASNRHRSARSQHR